MSPFEQLVVAFDVVQLVALAFLVAWGSWSPRRVVSAETAGSSPAATVRRRPAPAPDRFEVERVDEGENVLSTWRGDAAGAARRVILERAGGHRWRLKVDGKVVRTSEGEGE